MACKSRRAIAGDDRPCRAARIFTGYCTTRAGAYDAKSHDILISGDSRTVDLAHASVKVQPGTYDGANIRTGKPRIGRPGSRFTVSAGRWRILADWRLDQTFKNADPTIRRDGCQLSSAGSRPRATWLIVTDDANGNLVAGLADADATICRKRSSRGRTSFGPHSSLPTHRPAASTSSKGVFARHLASDDGWPSRAYSATASYCDGPPLHLRPLHRRASIRRAGTRYRSHSPSDALAVAGNRGRDYSRRMASA